jgi:hypothetical protein
MYVGWSKQGLHNGWDNFTHAEEGHLAGLQYFMGGPAGVEEDGLTALSSGMRFGGPNGGEAFGANDLVMGLYEHPETKEQLLLPFKRAGRGGKLAGQFISPPKSPLLRGIDPEPSLIRDIQKAMDDTVASGNKIRFNLDGYDSGWVRSPNNRYFGQKGITDQEIDYLRQNWGGRFNDSNTIFYRNGDPGAAPPWN